MLVNPKTQQLLDAFLKAPSHALLLVGSHTSGADELVKNVANSLHKTFSSVHRQIVPDGGTISIDAVRELRSEERLKTARTHSKIASVVSIVPIDAMQQEAQNALLKLLEEPPKGTLFILVCHDESKVLQTISSRCKRVDVLPVSYQQASAAYGTQKIVNQAYYISAGEALLLEQLVMQTDHPLIQTINSAKTLLSAPLVDRLQAVDGITKDKTTSDFIDALTRISRAALQTASRDKQAVWAHNLQQVLFADNYLQSHVQAKLVITNLFCQLK